MKIQRAKYEVKCAKLSSEFGEQMAARWYTPEQLSHIPRLAGGKNKGRMKGIIEWKKVSVGGWQRGKDGIGGVQRPGTRDVAILYSDRSGGMSRERRFESLGRVEDQIASDKARAEAAAALRAELEAMKP